MPGENESPICEKALNPSFVAMPLLVRWFPQSLKLLLFLVLAVIRSEGAVGKPPPIFYPEQGATNVSFLLFKSEGRWTDGARLGQIQLFQILSDDLSDTNQWLLIRDRYNAATPVTDWPRLEPNSYHVVRFRNITARDDPWSTVTFKTVPVPEQAGTILKPEAEEDGSLSFTFTNSLHGSTMILERTEDFSWWYDVASSIATNGTGRLVDPAPLENASYRLRAEF